jgi:hypothetical protein
MANAGQPTISLGATGDAVKRLERALRQTPNPGLAVEASSDRKWRWRLSSSAGCGTNGRRDRRSGHVGGSAGRRSDADTARGLDWSCRQ